MSRTVGAALIAVIIAGCSSEKPSDTTARPSTKPMTSNLQSDCREYLEKGPPEHMENYVPESLTEIVIAHGAKGEPLDAELAEIASIILMESASLSEIKDDEIRQYMQNGADLVKRVLAENE
ncbi:hypothetical protein [uncultured Rubinisphaera sp.]|uniref:hypothetical protein n=1 Tax=uncultured Rubinisphaera sp. TaxID=1678686 RepID=UPI0030DBC95D|tara:strand:+ start:130 stop:495 length:366 start_codon:yes stop_codon:yes gene_type:complete